MKTYSDEDIETFILDQLIRFADRHKEFNRSYVDDVSEYLDKNGFITHDQWLELKVLYDENNLEDFFGMNVSEFSSKE